MRNQPGSRFRGFRLRRIQRLGSVRRGGFSTTPIFPEGQAPTAALGDGGSLPNPERTLFFECANIGDQRPDLFIGLDCACRKNHGGAGCQ